MNIGKLFEVLRLQGSQAEEEKGAANGGRVRRNKDIKRFALPLDTPIRAGHDHFLRF